MAGVRNFNDDRVNHGNVETSRHSIVEEARVPHLVLGIEKVFLVERPANALHRSSLHLSLDVARMHRLACVLYSSVSEDGRLTRVGVDLDIRYMDTKRVGEALR